MSDQLSSTKASAADNSGDAAPSTSNIIATATDNSGDAATSTCKSLTTEKSNTYPNKTSASGNRGDNVPQTQSMIPNENNTTSQPLNYSQIAQIGPKYLSDTNEKFPKKDQAIIIPSHPEISIEEYIKAISQYITPRNIIYAHKISNNRTCIFLTSKLVVDNLLTQTQEIKINDHNLPIRKLITPAKRIIITGGSPIIPHVEIEKSLIAHQIKLVTGVTFMRTSIKTPEFQHIQTFNRQFYATLPDQSQIPETITVQYEEEVYRLFLAVSGTCYKCKKEGHLAKECPVNENLSQHTQQRKQPEETTDMEVESESSEEGSDQEPSIENRPANPTIEKLKETDKTKRPLTISTSSQSDTTIRPQHKKRDPTKKKKKSKKIKTDKKTPVPIEEMLVPVQKEIQDNPTEYPLNYDQLKQYIKETKGCSNIKKLTSTYTPQFNLIIDMLTKLRPELQHRSIKARFTKICEILEKNTEDTENDNFTSESSSSSENDIQQQ